MPREAIVSMVRLMADLGLVDRAAASSEPPESFHDNSFADGMHRAGSCANCGSKSDDAAGSMAVDRVEPIA